jgi:hypothetical protein
MLEKLLSVSEPWLQYAIRINLLSERKEDLVVLKKEALKDIKIQAYLSDVANFHNAIVRNHKDPGLSIHKLLFLLDLGFETDIPEIESAVKHIMSHKDKNGVYQSMTNIPPHYGGKGEDVFGWCLCDAPLLLMALHKAKIDYQQHLKQGVEHLSNLFKKQGFPCSVSEEHGKFRGPGRKDDCCPFATLIMLKLLSEIDEYQNGTIVNDGLEIILSLWENSRTRHPYMFYMGTDFRKLTAPAMWYDIVSVTDLLSKFDSIKTDARFIEMINLIKTKQDPDGMFKPESVYQKFKGWDFGQKKIPSPYLTYLCQRILQR